MPKANFKEWANPDKIADLLKLWSDGNSRPYNGSFVHLKVNNDLIVPEFL